MSLFPSLRAGRQVPPATHAITAPARMVASLPGKQDRCFFVVAQFADRKITYTRPLPEVPELVEGLLSTGALRVECEPEWTS